MDPSTDQTVMSPFWSLSALEGDNWKLAIGAVEAWRTGSMEEPIGERGCFFWKLSTGTRADDRRRGRREQAPYLAKTEVELLTLSILFWYTLESSGAKRNGIEARIRSFENDSSNVFYFLLRRTVEIFLGVSSRVHSIAEDPAHKPVYFPSRETRPVGPNILTDP